MIQKKICMVGVYGTGKTSLVRQFVSSRFSEKYHSTVGVKIDRKSVELDGDQVNLILWDVAGSDDTEDVPMSYLRGAAGLFYVADGTRPDTVEKLGALQARALEALGDVPSVVAINKVDLVDQWRVGDDAAEAMRRAGRHVLKTSAKSGQGVERAFHWLAEQTVAR
jgi:small GTP-binding protein